MIKINISEDKIKFENLHKSFFNDLNTTCSISDQKVTITNIDFSSYEKALTQFKKSAKKLAKNLRRF